MTVKIHDTTANSTSSSTDLFGVPLSGASRVSAHVRSDPTVTAATVVVQGSPDNSAWTAIVTFTGIVQGSAVAYGASGGYRYFRSVVSGYTGTGNVRVFIDAQYGAAATAAGPAVGAF